MPPSPVPHSPLGAHASFNFGPPDTPAGFALPSTEPVAQDIFAGCRPGPREPWQLLPFFAPAPGGPAPLPRGRYGRFLAWAGDKWMIGPLVFKLCTPFFPDTTDDRLRYAPVVCGYLEYDNTHSADAAELLFGAGGDAQALAGGGMTGFAFGTTHGCAAAASPEVGLRRDTAIFDTNVGPAAALHFVVPSHARRLFPLVLGFFQPGFHYTAHFPSLDAVLRHGLDEHSRYVAASDALDAAFMRSAAPLETKTRIALDTRDWLAHSRRLAGEPAIDHAPLRAFERRLAGHS